MRVIILTIGCLAVILIVAHLLPRKFDRIIKAKEKQESVSSMRPERSFSMGSGDESESVALTSSLGLNPALTTNGSPRPLPVGLETEHFQWARGDAFDTNVLALIAHNELEYKRMVEENGRIFRRQLVYRKEPLVKVVYRHRQFGMPVQQLVVPGLDGREFTVEILETDLHPSGLEGTFAGRLLGQPDSMVTIAFAGGREAFTIINPAENIYLVGDPRENGEIIVKMINPEKYVPAVCGTP